MSLECSYRLDLRFDGPVLSHAAGSLAFGLDAAMLRHRGKPVLNGSLVRGNLRHILCYFADDILSGNQAAKLTDHRCRWFGGESERGVDPNRAAVSFDFFWESASGEQPRNRRERYRITLENNGKTKEGQLMVAEDCFGVGSSSEFTGRIHALFQDSDEQQEFERWMGKALEYLPALGALKGVGYGRLQRAKLTRISSSAPTSAETEVPEAPQRLGLILILDRPFCIARPRTPDGNLLVSDDSIPGSVLKAVIARKLGNDPKLLEQRLQFDKLVFTHALPAPATRPGRAAPLPLSLACFGDTVRDLFRHKDPTLLDDGKRLSAPAFAPDWKETHTTAAERAWGEPPVRPRRLLSVRTAIAKEGGIAAQSQLFSLECVDPEHLWCADVDFTGIKDMAERRRVYAELRRLLSDGLDTIGKTRARADVGFRPRGFSPSERPEPLAGGLFLVTLVTPARLLPDAIQVSGINGDEALGRYYKKYWKRASGKTLRLSHYFAAEKRVGGVFHQGYYRKRQKGYHPEWLTQAGSVFVLKTDENDNENAAAQWLEERLRLGLPPAQDRSENDTWRTDPFIPQNGYGEIRVNLSRQIALSQPGEGIHYERA